jgi:hypothetical protein
LIGEVRIEGLRGITLLTFSENIRESGHCEGGSSLSANTANSAYNSASRVTAASACPPPRLSADHLRCSFIHHCECFQKSTDP